METLPAPPLQRTCKAWGFDEPKPNAKSLPNPLCLRMAVPIPLLSNTTDPSHSTISDGKAQEINRTGTGCPSEQFRSRWERQIYIYEASKAELMERTVRSRRELQRQLDRSLGRIPGAFKG